jgi:hypothetical protein
VASNSVPVAIGSRRIFAVPLDLAYRNLDVDAMAYARFAPILLQKSKIEQP